MTRTRTPLIALVVSLSVALPATGLAQDASAQCADAFERAQRERAAGRYLPAREAARACSSVECPQAFIRECVNLYEKLRVDIPSVVFAAQDRNGKELVDVAVDIDGVRTVENLDGRPVELEPGKHTFSFHPANLPPVEKVQVLRVGEQHRLISVVIDTGAPPSAQASGAAPGGPPILNLTPDAEAQPSVPVASYVLGGVGLLALGSFTFFRLAGMSDYDDLKGSCSPGCDPDEGDSVRTKLYISYASLGVGVAALAGAATIYLVNTKPTQTGGLRLRVGATAERATAELLGRF